MPDFFPVADSMTGFREGAVIVQTFLRASGLQFVFLLALAAAVTYGLWRIVGRKV